MLRPLDDIAWDRLATAHGRATDVRTLLVELSENDAATGPVAELARRLEHQDSVTQVAPYAVPFLVGALPRLSPAGATRVCGLLALLARSAGHALGGAAIHPLAGAEDPQLPVFVEDILWEDHDVPRASWLGWQARTLLELHRASGILARLSEVDDPPLQVAAEKLLALVPFLR